MALSKSYIKRARTKKGGSNVGKKKFADGSKRRGPYAGPSGGAPKGSYPIPDLKRARAALSLAHNAPNPSGIKAAVYRKFPQLKKQFGGYASTPLEYSLGLLAGKNKFLMGDDGPHNFTMTPHGIPIEYPVAYVGMNDGYVVDSGVAYPGEDFTVMGEEIQEYPMFKYGGIYQSGGRFVRPIRKAKQLDWINHLAELDEEDMLRKAVADYNKMKLKSNRQQKYQDKTGTTIPERVNLYYDRLGRPSISTRQLPNAEPISRNWVDTQDNAENAVNMSEWAWRKGEAKRLKINGLNTTQQWRNSLAGLANRVDRNYSLPADYTPPAPVTQQSESSKLYKNKKIQEMLKRIGFDPGPIDGILGKKTGDAVRRFQESMGIRNIDGILGPETLGALNIMYNRLTEKPFDGGTLPEVTVTAKRSPEMQFGGYSGALNNVATLWGDPMMYSPPGDFFMNRTHPLQGTGTRIPYPNDPRVAVGNRPAVASNNYSSYFFNPTSQGTADFESSELPPNPNLSSVSPFTGNLKNPSDLTAGDKWALASSMIAPAVNIGRGLFEPVRKYPAIMNPEAAGAWRDMSRLRYNPDFTEQRLMQNRLSQDINENMGSNASRIAALTQGQSNLNRAFTEEQRRAANMNNQYKAQAAQMRTAYGADQQRARMQQLMMDTQARAAKDAMLTTGLGQLGNTGMEIAKLKNNILETKLNLAASNSLTPNYQIPDYAQLAAGAPDGVVQYQPASTQYSDDALVELTKQIQELRTKLGL